MAKKNKIKGSKLPVLTNEKLLRLLLFTVFAALVFVLHRFVPVVRTFGWGFTFGMVCMAILTG